MLIKMFLELIKWCLLRLDNVLEGMGYIIRFGPQHTSKYEWNLCVVMQSSKAMPTKFYTFSSWGPGTYNVSPLPRHSSREAACSSPKGACSITWLPHIYLRECSFHFLIVIHPWNHAHLSRQNVLFYICLERQNILFLAFLPDYP